MQVEQSLVGKVLSKPGHGPTEGVGLVEQVDIEAGVGQIEGALNAADAAADDDDPSDQIGRKSEFFLHDRSTK